MKLTDLTVRALKPPTDRAQQTFYDDSFPGFGIRVSKKGTKSWVVMTGRQRKLLTLCRYPDVGLKDARDAARRALLAPKQPLEATITLKEAIDLFLANSAAKNRPKTLHGYKDYLNRFFKPLFTTKLADITTGQVMARVEAIRDTPTQQVHFFNVANTMFRFCVNRRLITRSPLLGVSSPGKIPSRERVLTHKELKAVWQASLIHPFTFAQIVQLCILTGQRRGELVKLTWGDIDQENRTITIRAEIAKNGIASTIPYGDMTADVLAKVAQEYPDQQRRNDAYLFPGRLKGFFWGFSRAKELFDKDCAIAHWQIHDIRRTYVTLMAEIGVPQIVVERLVNHVSGGAQSPISRVYNRHTYMPEMRDAILKYENFLRSLTRPG